MRAATQEMPTETRRRDANLLGNVRVLITAHTDPSWTPLFVAINGLVTVSGR